MNHGIFLVLVSFLYLGKSDTSASPSFWSRRLPANTASPRSSLFQGVAYKTEFINFPCRKPILSNLQQEKQVLPLIPCVTYSRNHHRAHQQRDGDRIKGKGSLFLATCMSFSLLPPSQLINKQGPAY